MGNNVISLRTCMRLWCVVLLLFAQQTALTHATWHAAQAHQAQEASAHAHADDTHDHRFGSELCIYHLAFCDVTGGSCGSGAQPWASESAPVRHPSGAIARLSIEAVPATCRGPPERS